MKLVCDCGNEGKIFESATINGITEGYLDDSAFGYDICKNGHGDSYTIHICKKCGAKVIF